MADKPAQPDMADLPQARVAEKRRSMFSLVWIVPLLAVLIGVWLAWRAYSQTGPAFTIVFATAEGIEAGKTKIKYKSVDVGVVEAINLAPDRSRIVVRARMEKNEACFQCHKSFRENLAAHTHHESDSSGSLCYNCHMPHTTYGVLSAIRSHQVSSPRVSDQLATGRPNACSLCHLDQTLAWSGTWLREWYKQPLPVLGTDESSVAERFAQGMQSLGFRRVWSRSI